MSNMSDQICHGFNDRPERPAVRHRKLRTTTRNDKPTFMQRAGMLPARCISSPTAAGQHSITLPAIS